VTPSSPRDNKIKKFIGTTEEGAEKGILAVEKLRQGLKRLCHNRTAAPRLDYFFHSTAGSRPRLTQISFIVCDTVSEARVLFLLACGATKVMPRYETSRAPGKFSDALLKRCSRASTLVGKKRRMYFVKEK
jgi:hypothetical protein